jgi:DNA polymerase I-like protein with 3'-5' exonuclease and polymerase domains
MQNITEDLRHIFIADEGYKIAGIDKEQAESREVGYYCGITFDDWTYLDAVESGDIHTYCARLLWPNLPWTGNLKLDKDIANQPFYRHLSYRDMVKRAGHGTNYLGQPYTIANEIKVPMKLVQDFQEPYFQVFPCIRNMHYHVAEQLQTKGYLTNIFGRRRDFFDRLNSKETLRAAVAYLFQSATADDMNLGLYRIWKHMPKAELLLQLHDAVYFQFEEKENEEEIIREAQKLLDVEFIHKDRSFIVPTDPLTGYNLGHRFKLDETGKPKEVNQKGLDKVKWN